MQLRIHWTSGRHGSILSRTGGSHATREFVCDSTVAGRTAGAGGQETPLYVTVSGRRARQARAPRGGGAGEHHDWRAVRPPASHREQVAATVLSRTPRGLGGASAQRSPLWFFPLGSWRS